MNASLIRKPPVRAIASRNGTDELIAGYGDTWLMGIRLAQAAELSAVQEIDQASARMFNDVGMPQIAGMLWTAEDLAAYREAGRLWVITGLDDCPAGFPNTEMVAGCFHVEQVSVDPGSARRTATSPWPRRASDERHWSGFEPNGNTAGGGPGRRL
jgi:hypothetical protein